MSNAPIVQSSGPDLSAVHADGPPQPLGFLDRHTGLCRTINFVAHVANKIGTFGLVLNIGGAGMAIGLGAPIAAVIAPLALGCIKWGGLAAISNGIIERTQQGILNKHTPQR